MDARHNRLGLQWGAPGLVAHVVGSVILMIGLANTRVSGVATVDADRLVLWGTLTSIAGTILLAVGLAYYALAKGQHPAWCLLGLCGDCRPAAAGPAARRAADGDAARGADPVHLSALRARPP